MSQAPKVFISYGHDSPEHKERVLGLCTRLRREGIDCDLDRYHEAPPEGWPTWMHKAIRDASFVLVVCSKLLHERFEGTAATGVGLGAKWEGAIITSDLYLRESHNVKYIPVLLASEDRQNIPELLSAATHYDLSKSDGYELLYRRITAQPLILREDLGERIELSARDVQWQDPALPVSGSSATIEFRTDLLPDEVSVYEALPAIEKGEPVAVRWPAISDELYETLSARRPDLQRQLLDRGVEPGELLLRAIEAFDVALRDASRMRDRAAERLPLMWGGMVESGYWGSTLDGAFRPALEHFLALANVRALLSMGGIQFKEDFRSLPGGLNPATLTSQTFQLPAVAEIFDAEPPFWAVDVELAGVSMYIFAPRAMAAQVVRSGADSGGRFFRDFFVPQMEREMIAQDRQLNYSPNEVTVKKLRDESFEETSWRGV